MSEVPQDAPAAYIPLDHALPVLLHASLEDLLRRIARYRIPDGGEEALRQISLIGRAPREKFSLGELARFRGKTVDEVLSESVRHLL